MQFRGIVLLILLSLFIALPANSQSGKVRKAIKKQEKTEKSLEKQYDKSRETALKNRYNIQSQEVKERMKASRKKVDQYYRKKNKPVFEDLFKRKKRRK